HSGAQPYSDGQQGYPGGQRYSGGQPSGPHRRPSVPDPASQHRSAGYPGGQPPPGQHPSGQYASGQPPRQYPQAQPPSRHTPGNPYAPEQHARDPYAPDRQRASQAPAGPPPHQPGPPARYDPAYPGSRPGSPTDGSVLGTADSLHLALTQDAAVIGERAPLIDRSGRHRRPDQPGRR
ncbi:MAG TPA: hypothetical protein VH008_09880, partial [Pseudonocardia sp.]|nr:hypothetical protein [Pseudonocardia sp.]